MADSRRQAGPARTLTASQVHQVHAYALRVMEEVGCRVLSAEALDLLGHAGCDVGDPDRVKIPAGLVEQALEAAPGEIDVFDRDGKLAMRFARDACYYGTGSDCPTTIDLHTGERRTTVKADVEALARFCDALPNLDFVMSFGIATDAPAGGNFVHQYEAMLLNARKPIIVTGHGRGDMTTMIEMAGAALGGVERVSATPPLILYTEPLAPLVHTDMGVVKGLVCCEHGVPFIYIGTPMAGATGPATLEGTLVQTVAESLAGLVIFQQKQPGAKFIFGGDPSVLDMTTVNFSYGAPEQQRFNAALADMAHFYGLPFFCIAGATDAKTLDAQAGLEYALSIYNATMNGCNIIHDCGYLESGLTSSFESVLLADEVIGLVKYMLRPFDFNEETVPLETMQRIGPGGDFLTDEHTLRTFRDAFWFPRFLDRRNFDGWQQAGAQDLRTALNDGARRIVSELEPDPLPGDTVARIRDCVTRHRPDATGSHT